MLGESLSQFSVQCEHENYIRYEIQLLMLLYTLTITLLYATLIITLLNTLTIMLTITRNITLLYNVNYTRLPQRFYTPRYYVTNDAI